MIWDAAASFLDGGWINPESRNREQMEMTNAYHERIGSFGRVNPMRGDSPEFVLYAQAQLDVLGELLLKIWQTSGSCVGAGACNAYADAMLGDIIHRNDNERVELPFPWATYGKGRQLAGMRRKGEGSFGSAQAEASEPDRFGYLPMGHPGLPQGQKRGMWLKWSAATEISWSYAPQFPISERELALESSKFGIHTATQLRNADEWESGVDQGFGITLASMFGTSPRVQGNVLLGRWDKSWSHQMSSSGKWRHPRFGRIFWVQNQWGDIHGKCPTVSKTGQNGGFWILDKDAEKICRTGEVYAHSNTGNFEPRKFRWTKVATYED